MTEQIEAEGKYFLMVKFVSRWSVWVLDNGDQAVFETLNDAEIAGKRISAKLKMGSERPSAMDLDIVKILNA